MPPHSKTVRGTLDNPKTKEAMAQGNTPRMEDPAALTSSSKNEETKNDSTQNDKNDTPGGYGKPADTYGLKKDAPSAPSSFEQAKEKNGEKTHGDNYGLDKGAKSKL